MSATEPCPFPKSPALPEWRCGKHDPPDPNCPDRPSALWLWVVQNGPKLSRPLRDEEYPC